MSGCIASSWMAYFLTDENLFLEELNRRQSRWYVMAGAGTCAVALLFSNVNHTRKLMSTVGSFRRAGRDPHLVLKREH